MGYERGHRISKALQVVQVLPADHNIPIEDKEANWRLVRNKTVEMLSIATNQLHDRLENGEIRNQWHPEEKRFIEVRKPMESKGLQEAAAMLMNWYVLMDEKIKGQEDDKSLSVQEKEKLADMKAYLIEKAKKRRAEKVVNITPDSDGA